MQEPIIVVAFRVEGHGIKTFAGTTAEDVSRQWSEFRDTSCVGASEVEGGECTVNGIWLGRMSYNGKIWPDKDWKPGDQPIHDPYEKEPSDRHVELSPAQRAAYEAWQAATG